MRKQGWPRSDHARRRANLRMKPALRRTQSLSSKSGLREEGPPHSGVLSIVRVVRDTLGRVAVTSYPVNRFWTDIGSRYAAPRGIANTANYREDTATR